MTDADRLRGAEVSRRKRTEKKNNRIAEVERLRDCGLSTSEIANRLGTSTETVRRAYKILENRT